MNPPTLTPEARAAELHQFTAKLIAAVGRERAADYGTPEENHARTAALWSAYLGRPVTSHDVCMLNVLQKASRTKHKPTSDTLLDIAGYALNAELIRCAGFLAGFEPTGGAC